MFTKTFWPMWNRVEGGGLRPDLHVVIRFPFNQHNSTVLQGRLINLYIFGQQLTTSIYWLIAVDRM